MARRRRRTPSLIVEFESIDEAMDIAYILREERELIEAVEEAEKEAEMTWGIVEEDFKEDIEEEGDIWYTVIPKKEEVKE